jgi:ABC-type transporter Mla MlaB component
VRLVGELDISNRMVITGVLERFAGTPADICLDLGELGFIDVGALAALAAFAQRHRPYRVILQRASPLITRLVPMIWPDSGLELEAVSELSSEQVW